MHLLIKRDRTIFIYWFDAKVFNTFLSEFHAMPNKYLVVSDVSILNIRIYIIIMMKLPFVKLIGLKLLVYIRIYAKMVDKNPI